VSERQGLVRRVFHEALDRSPEQRATYLASACGGDASLRSEVEALLSALSRADRDGFIDGPDDALAAAGSGTGAPGVEGGDEPSPAIGPTIGGSGRYELLQELGRGGVGVVLKARDRRLARLVALKFLHAVDAADPQTRERFEREARSASAVSHPRLCTIYEVGEDEGQPFLVMELLEGATLQTRLSEGLLPLPELLDVAIQIAEGVEAIHAASIIHRDLKPANVFLTPTGVKILDFGLAKVGRATEVTLDGFQTQPGLMVGTIAYMAPEQARGEELDFRVDVFSFGAVLYEMATGQPAFGRATAGLTFDRLLNREPPPPSSLNPAIPPAVDEVIARALAKEPADRYPSMRALRTDLERLQRSDELGLRPHPTSRAARRRILGGAALALAVLGGTTVVLRGRGALPPDIDSVAVLPFGSVASDAAGESLAAGVTESLVNSLSRLPGVRVAPRSAAARYRNEGDLARAARELGVRAVVTGRVTQHEATLLVSAELTDLARNAQLWGERYQRRLTDIFEVEEEVAQAIADRLRPRLAGAARPRLVTRATAVPEAYRLYLRGRQEWERRTDEAIRRAITFYEAAIEADPTYPLPHAGLADAYLSFRREPPLETRPRAKLEAERALALDGSLAEAQTSLAMVLFVFDWDWAGAEAGFRRAIALDPRHATAHHWYGLYLMAMGRSVEARRELEQARELDPFSAVIRTNLARNEFFAGNDDAASTRLQSALQADRTFFLALGLLSQVRLRQGHLTEAVSAADEASRNDDAPESAVWRGFALARAGQVAAARRVAQELEATGQGTHVDGYRVALVYGALGDPDRAFAWLDTAYAKRSPWLAYILRDPAVDDLRRDPRFGELLGRLRLFPAGASR
jgi:eukaryotic-like serine/threonine-protein kinase